MNRLDIKSVVICLVLAGCASILAQSSNPPQKGSTKFGLPSAKPDTGGKNALVSNSPTAATPDGATISKNSSADFSTNWGSVSRVFVTFEGSRQGKFRGTAQPGKGTDPGSECLSYVLQPQPGIGIGEKPSTTIHKESSITITKASDGATSQLLNALETAEPLKTVTFEFVEERGALVKATLSGASIVSIQQHFDAKTRGVFEDITLNFRRIEFQ